jgi:hypothetical protein
MANGAEIAFGLSNVSDQIALTLLLQNSMRHSRVLNGWHPGCLMLRITGILANGGLYSREYP